jgi:hypothetical protein
MIRAIRTDYYFKREIVKTTHAVYAFNAVPNCIGHLQTNQYGATTAEVFNEVTGKLHAVIRRSVQGEIHIVFKEKVKEGE